MLLRKITLVDICEILPIELSSFERPWNGQMISDELSGEYGISLLIEDSGICGYLFARDLIDCVELLRIAVKPEKRSSGLGRRLLGELCKLAQNRRIILEVEEDNIAAISLYKIFGFEVTGKRRAYYGSIDALLMDRPPVQLKD